MTTNQRRRIYTSLMAALVIMLLSGLGLIACTQEEGEQAVTQKKGEQTVAQKRGEQAVVYTARKIITMDESAPEATAVAVIGNKITAVGSLKQVKQKLGGQSYDVVDTFIDLAEGPWL